jgi:prevent-host-death family protein
MGMRTVSIEKGRRTLGEVVDLARLAGEPTMITRNNKPAAVVVSADWYQIASEALDSALPRLRGQRRPTAQGTGGPAGDGPATDRGTRT